MEMYGVGDEVTRKEPMISPLTGIGSCESPEITYPIPDNIKKIGKSGIEPMLPHDGQHSYPLDYL